MSAAAAGITAGGTILGFLGAQEAGKVNQRIANYNAAVSDLQAADAIARGHEASVAIGEAGRKVIGEQRAGYATQGVDVNRGSAALIQSDTERQIAKDIITTEANALREAWGYKTQATGLRMQGTLARREGDLGAGSTLLTGGAQAIAMASRARYES